MRFIRYPLLILFVLATSMAQQRPVNADSPRYLFGTATPVTELNAPGFGDVHMSLTHDGLEAFFARGLSRYTDRTVTDELHLRRILAEVRREGWAIVDEQLDEGLCSVAAPIVDPNGRVSAALSVCAHAGRVDPVSLRTDFLPLVLETARRISAAWIRR